MPWSSERDPSGFRPTLVVVLSGTNHAEDRPCHLVLKYPKVPVLVNRPVYSGPDKRYYLAGSTSTSVPRKPGLYPASNSQNCIHGKTCDFIDPAQNIERVTPGGGGARIYPNLKGALLAHYSTLEIETLRADANL